MGRKKTKSQATKAKRKDRRLRRRGGVVSTFIAPNDMALFIRANGRLQIHHSRAEVRTGNSAFWGHLLAWLFKGEDKDAAERRQILTDDFLFDLQEARMKAEQRKEALDMLPEEVSAEFRETIKEVIEDSQEVLDGLAEGPNGECPNCGEAHGSGAGCPGTPERDGGPV